MHYRSFGKTGLIISELGFGGIPIIRLQTTEAIRVIKHAFEKGITFYDTANAYKDSEYKMGQAFQGIRDKVVIATKTQRRDAMGVVEHLNNSLSNLQTDYIDLFQLHQVAQEKDWDLIAGPGGALEAVLKAKEQGKIRHIGITSHSLPMAIKLSQLGIFETVQFPFNFIEHAAKDELHVIARDMDLGIIVMKPFAGGVIDNAALAFKFLRQYPDLVVIPGYDSIESINQIIALYDHPNIITTEDTLLMDQYRADLGRQFCRRCEYCQPCPSGVMITPAMGYQIIAQRMSPAVAVDFAKKPMETVTRCINCGLCTTRCPYELPIPEILKKNYDLFIKHGSVIPTL